MIRRYMQILQIVCVMSSMLMGCSTASVASVRKTTLVESTETEVFTQASDVVRADEIQRELGVDTSVDYDLTVMGSDMVYASIYQLLSDPQTYEGKSYKIDGIYTAGIDEGNGNLYHYVFVQDAAACCASGIEFVLVDDTLSYPEELEENIEIIGTFDAYTEEGSPYTYARLNVTEIRILQ